MAQYKITDPETGQTLTISGDSPPTEQEMIDLFAQNPVSQVPTPAAETLQPKEQEEPSLMQAASSLIPAIGAAEVGVEAATGFAGLVAGGYKTALNLIMGDDLGEQGKQVTSILDSVSYQPKTRTAEDIKKTLASVSKASMTAPSMLYSGIGVAKGMLTGEEKEAMLAEAEMSVEAFQQDPFRTLGQDAEDLTGSSDVGAAVSTSLFAMSMMLGASSPKQISALNKLSKSKKAEKIKEFQEKIINNQLDPVSEFDPTTKLVQYNPKSLKLESVSPWQLANDVDMTPVQRAEIGAYITKNKAAQGAIKAGMSRENVALYGGLSPTDSGAALKMLDIVKKSKNPLFAGKNRTTDIVGRGIVERYRFLKAENIKSGRKLGRVVKSEAKTPVSFDSAMVKFQKDLSDDGISLVAGQDGKRTVNYGSSAMGESPEAVKLINGIVNRLQSKGGQTLQEGHFLKKYIDENSKLQRTSEGLTDNAKRIIKKLRGNVNLSLRRASPNYAEANIRFSDTIEVIKELQSLAGNKIDLDGANSRSALGTSFRGMLSNRQTRAAQLDLISKMDKVAGKYGAEFNDSIYNQMITASQLEKQFGLAPANSHQGQVGSGVASAILDAAIDPTQASARVGARFFKTDTAKAKVKAEKTAIDAIEKMLKEQTK